MICVFLPDNASAQNYDFSSNGDMVLMPSSCTVTAQINDVWVLEMVHPLDEDGRYSYIKEEGVLKVPTWQTYDQLYRISQVEKTETEVKAIAYPIFLDARNNVFIVDRTVQGSGSTVLTSLLADGPTKPGTSTPLYSASCNISTAKRLEVSRRNFIDVLNGSGGGETFIDLWGGEISYNNLTIEVREELGTDRDVEIRYGKDILGSEYVVDYSTVCTRLYPEGYGGYTITSGNAWVDSPLINNYVVLYVRNVVFDHIRMLEDVPADDAVNYIACASQAEMNAQLRQACIDLYNEGLDKPTVSMSVDLVPLAATDQYKEFSALEHIQLGDTVHCYNERIGVTSDARAIGIVWDCCRDRAEKVEIGDFTYDYFSDTTSKVNAISRCVRPDGSLMAERVAGFLDAEKTAIHILRTSAQQADVMGLLFEDLVTGSPTYGAMAIGTKGLVIAKEWDDATGDWAWETAITANGVHAPMVVTNAISGESATNWWDLELGEISFQTIKTYTDDTAASAASAISSSMTGLEICNRIFQSGEIKGFQTRTIGGVTKFYMSFDSFIGGTGQLGGGSNGNGILEVYDASDNLIVKISNKGIENFNASGNKIFESNANGSRFYNSSGYLVMTQDADGTTIYDGTSGEHIVSRINKYGISQVTDINSITTNTYDMVMFDGALMMGENIAIWSQGGSTSKSTLLGFSLGYIDFTATRNGSSCMHMYFGGRGNSSGILLDALQFLFLGMDKYNSYASMLFAELTRDGWSLYVPDNGYVSDESLKTNFSEALEALPLINAVPIKSYDWKESGEHVSVGLTAQDIQKVIPEVVHRQAEDDPLTVSYTALVPFLIKAVQELSAQVEDLKNQVSLLKEGK